MRKIVTPLMLYVAIPGSLAVGLIWWPLWAIAAVGMTVAFLVSRLPVSKSVRFVMALLGLLLLGYAFFGRSFAYLGLPPVYIGEAVLGVALVASIANGALWAPMRSRVSWLLIVFVLWCAVRTIPYIQVYGLDALRDAVLWGYSSFAVIMAGLLLRGGSLHTVTACYRRLIPFYLVWIVSVGAIPVLAPSIASSIGESSSTVFQLKPGDTAVHLAGIASFLISGAHQMSPRGRWSTWLKEWCLWPVWAAGFLLFGSQSRGGLLSIVISLAVVLVLRRGGKWGRLAVIGMSGLALFVLLDLEFDLGTARKVSPQQILFNLSSITGGGDPSYEGTRRWRLDWWSTIIDYTVKGGFFWGGKGFGVNLADEDGFQVDATHLLRSPHNGHLAILARAGVPGFALWILLQGSMCIGLLTSYVRSRREREQERAGVIAWILAYWTAFTVNGAFDVYLEGPPGGIWFWVMFGVGLAVLVDRSTARRSGVGQPVALCRQSSSARAA